MKKAHTKSPVMRRASRIFLNDAKVMNEVA